MTKKNKVDMIFDLFLTHNNSPKTELLYNTLFELLIAVVLSAQATDVSVNKVTKSLFKIANTPEQMILLSQDELEKHINSIGLYKTKAKNIINLSKKIIVNYNSVVPDNYNDLIMLDGVGRKTANVILNAWFNKPTIAVDTHVFRVSNRLGLVHSNNMTQVELTLQNIIKKKYINNAHNWLVLHGRYICKSQKPLCNSCFLSHLCSFKQNNS